MNRRRLAWALAALLSLPAVTSADTGAAFEPTAWAALLPPGWDPQQRLASYGLERMDDGDPAAVEVLERLRREWDAAPANPVQDGRRVRLSGYMVPVDADKEHIRSFLLVPYFGACIHEPAPPANQTVHVLLERAMRTADRGTSAVTVNGTLLVQRSTSPLGAATYRLSAEQVEPWRP